MEVLITGLNNYLARNIANFLADEAYQVTCLVRKRQLIKDYDTDESRYNVVEWDVFGNDKMSGISKETTVAFFFSQSDVTDTELRVGMEVAALDRYLEILDDTACRHLIYVTKLTDERTDYIEQHLRRRRFTYTIVRVSNIIGKGSLLVGIFNKLASKKILVIPPGFEENSCQPIAILDVCRLINCIILDPNTFGRKFDIGGEAILSYKDLFDHYLSIYNINKLKVKIPGYAAQLTNVIARYFYRIDSDLSQALTRNLSKSVLCKYTGILDLYPIELTPLDDSLKIALDLLESRRFPLSTS